MEVTIKTTFSTVKQDLSQQSAKNEVVETLKTNNKVNILPSLCLHFAKITQYAVALLPHANERFRYYTTYGTVPPENLREPPVTCSKEWKDYANNAEIVAVATFQLQGDPESIWKWGYDKCLKGEQLGDEELVYLHRAVTCIIICNAWLARRLVPKPQGDIKLNLIYVNYVA
ncbi:hypothetical protein AJ79_08881 [Helicocarpus griseus UAMH5409]|uniref:Uncharacterized protein n=1 Tax=Helicocarpus griseus UAMH5409 TaxID=1447875 RepID=A0A2B7WPL2_9EURO|nr:hypothetical protein AJ79_08881 [Helicocarpus griseus UAMH5409]